MAAAKPIPAAVQYWFNYCNQWNNALGGNVLHLFPNNLAIPLNPPLVGGPPAQPAPFNGPFLIRDPAHGQRPANQKHPGGDKGAGVFLGFCPVQDPNLPNGNASANPMRWCVAYGKIVRPRAARGRKRPATQLWVWRRPKTYTGQTNDRGPTRRIRLEDIWTIQSLRGLTRAQILAYVQAGETRDARNQPGEYDAHLAHLRALQRAHLSMMFGPLQQQTQTEYGL